MTRVLVTCAAYPTGRNAVRALIQHEGIEVFATDSREQALARLPFDVPRVLMPKPEDPAFVDACKQFCKANDIRVVLPGLDAMTVVLSRHKESFAEADISIPVPDYPVLMRGVDKANLMQCAKEAGLPYPKSVCLHSECDIPKIDSLHYPVITKPTFGTGARGVEIFEHPPSDWKELKKVLRKGEVLAQEYIPGEAGSIYTSCFCYDQQHQIKFSFQSRSTKTEFEFGGAAMAGVSLHDPKLRSYGERLITAIGPWVGISMMEFKRDSRDEELYILDCNARIWGYSSLADDAGISFPLASVLVAQGKPFRTHDDYLTDMHVERQGLLDESHYVFSCGKRLDLLNPLHRPARRIVSLVTEDCVLSSLNDPQVDATVVLDAIPTGITHEKLYHWRAPPYLRRDELAYWIGHIFRATEVRVIYSSKDLRRAWWFE